MAAPLNPLRCSGAGLRPPILLAAKLLVLLLLAYGEFFQFKPPFLPFLPIFDALPFPGLFQRGLQGLFLAASAALLFNRAVRASCLVLAATMLVSILAARQQYANHRVFATALLAMIGLEGASTDRPRFLRWQLAFVYASAGLNKLLEADWRSGIYVDNFMTVYAMELSRHAAGFFPPLFFARAISFGTIAAELGLGALWAGAAWPAFTVWAGLLFHASLTAATGITFGYFLFAAVIAQLAMLRWLDAPATVLYDGDCGICAKTREYFEETDFDLNFRWSPWQSAKDRHGISEAALKKSLYLIADGKKYAGFRAFKILLLYTPLFHFFALGGILILYQRQLLGLAIFPLAAFFPAFEPIGERVYRLVADNRHRLSAACGLGPRR